MSSISDCSDGNSLAKTLDLSPPTPSGFEAVFQPGYSTDVGPDAKLLHEQQRAIGSSVQLLQDGIEPTILTSDQMCPSASKRAPVYFFATISTTLLPLLGLAVWVVYMPEEHYDFTTLTGARLGGQFTQTQAKSIDFVCSALVAPLIMAAFNFVWFSCARVCVANEVEATSSKNGGISLQTLTTASSQSTGTYSPFAFWDLLQSRTWRMVSLGFITLASAIGTSALSNIIAYESFVDGVASESPYTLRLLYDPYITQNSQLLYSSTTLYDFSNGQQNLAGKNISTMFNDLTFVPGELDGEGGYIGMNATTASMQAIDGSVASVNNIPGYRLTATCTPTKLMPNSSFMVITSATGYTQFMIGTEMSAATRVALDFPDDTESYFSTYEYEGSIADVFYDMTVHNQFLTFGSSSMAGEAANELITLVHFETDTLTNMSSLKSSTPLSTDYGILDPIYQEVSIPTASQGYESMSTYPLATYALQCSLHKQVGLLNFTRQADRTWLMASSIFDGETEPYVSFLPDWNLKFTETRSAPPLADTIFSTAVENDLSDTTLNFTTAVDNIVFASGEVARIAYNVASLNISHDQPDYFYNITGNIDQEFYRVTYVPALLLVGIVCIILCGSMTLILIMSVRKSMSWKMFRVLNTVRLVVDVLGGDLTQETAEFTRLAQAGSQEISDWATKYHVTYEKTFSEQDGKWRSAVRLRTAFAGNDT